MVLFSHPAVDFIGKDIAGQGLQQISMAAPI